MTKIVGHSVITEFNKFSKLFRLIGIFPTFHSNNKNSIKRSILFCYIIFFSVAFHVLQLAPNYIRQNVWFRHVSNPTDQFAFFGFISTIYILRLICFFITLWKARSIYELLQSFQKYDTNFPCSNAVVRENRKLPTPFSPLFYFLSAGAMTNIIGNIAAGSKDFQKIFGPKSNDNFYLFGISVTNIHLVLGATFVSHGICELAFVFFVSVLFYYIKCLKFRVVSIQLELSKFENLKSIEIFSTRLRELFRISKSIGECSGGFLLCFAGMSQFLLLVALHLLIVYVLDPPIPNDFGEKSLIEDRELLKTGTFAIIVFVGFTLVRLGIFVYLGDLIEMAVSI